MEGQSEIILTKQIDATGVAVRWRVSGRLGRVTLKGRTRDFYPRITEPDFFRGFQDVADQLLTLNREEVGKSVPPSARAKVVRALADAMAEAKADT